ncbi:N-6 DNA methylase [Niallia sp. FSL M8-0099]|uniref:N-6 DNA methylase n=1 Tax=Niallia sp. FSL M8-0099 TaxID=2954519 RepID=UPI0030F703C6
MKKDLINLLDRHRGMLSPQQQLQIGSLMVSVGDSKTLRQIASSINVVKQLEATLESLSYSQFTKERLQRDLYQFKSSISVSELVDMILDYAKLLEVTAPLTLFDELIELTEEKYGSVKATHQQTEIVKHFFNIQEHETVFSGRIGKGFEVTDLLQNKTLTSIYGQDFAVEDLVIAEIRLYLAGFTNVQLKQANILTAPAFGSRYFNYIYDTPRFGYKPMSEEMDQLKHDPRFSYYGVPSRMNADLGFMVAGIQTLNEKGKGAFFFTTGALSRSGADEKIRERLVTNDVIEAVIEFPGGFYAPATGISSVLVLVNKAKMNHAQDQILFINATALSENVRKKTMLTVEGLKEILSILSERREVKGISKILGTNELHDYELVPSRYVFENEMDLDMYGTVEVDLHAFETLNTVPLHKVATTFRGYNALPKDESPNGNVAMLKISDIIDGVIQEHSLTRYDLGGRVKIESYRLQHGDIVLSIRGQLKVAIFESKREDVLLSQNFIGIRCNKDIDPAFLKLYLESPTMQFIMHNKLTGSTVLNLPPKDIEEFRIPVLPLEQQQQIVAIYQKEQDELKAELEKIQSDLKKSKLKVFKQMGIEQTFNLK